MKAKAVVHKEFRIGRIDDRVYGAFLEHLGRAIYTGIYEPGHLTADEHGFRRDVIEMVRELNVPVTRYPGGNFVSAYNWEDGIGPKESRPVTLDYAWRTKETNEVGIDEFAAWCEAAGTELMLAVNLGSRGLDEARGLLEYCNHPGGSRWSDLRIKNGRREPYDVRLWCLGNEMDGPWQVGHKTAYEYGRIANETAKAMKAFDPTLQLVACGSSHSFMPTYPQWEADVLDECYDNVDYLSLHMYFENYEDDYLNFLAKPVILDRYIQTVSGVIDYVKAKKRSKKDIYISFDEWNVWYHCRRQDNDNFKNWDWPAAPALLEEVYNFEDVLVVGCILNTFIRRADRVRIACIAQLVNAIAPITTERGGRAFRHTIYYPYLLASRHGRGESLAVAVDTPRYDAKAADDVPYIDVAAVHDQAAGTVALFVVNKHPDEEAELTVDLAGFPSARLIEHILIHHPDLKAVNSADAPDVVKPQLQNGSVVEDGRVLCRLKPRSYNLIRLSV
jgi:alpha-N-arabinofuranosidase